MEDTMALTRPAGTLSHRMGEGQGEGILYSIRRTHQ